MALFLELGERREVEDELVLHRQTTPGPLSRVYLNPLWQAAWLSSWRGEMGVEDRVVHHR